LLKEIIFIFHNLKNVPVWYENLSGVVIRPDKSKHKHRWWISLASVDSVVIGSRQGG